MSNEVSAQLLYTKRQTTLTLRVVFQETSDLDISFSQQAYCVDAVLQSLDPGHLIGINNSDRFNDRVVSGSALVCIP